MTVGKLEATLSSFKTEARMMHSDLIGRLRAQDMERQALVRRHEAELTAKDLEAIKERTYFRGKIEALNSQLRKVRCERSAHDRAMTYWLKEGQIRWTTVDGRRRLQRGRAQRLDTTRSLWPDERTF